MENKSRIYEKLLDDSFEKIGLWYQDNSSEHVCGKIRYDDEGIFLDTIFAIDDPNNKRHFLAEIGNNKLNKFSQIRGIIETSEFVVLEGLTQIASSNIKKTYQVSRMLIGKNLVDEFKFNKLSIKYSNLYNWLLPQSIKIDHDWDDPKTIITHTPPKNIEVELNENFKLNISFGHIMSHSYHVKDFTIPQDASLILISKTLCSFDELFKKHNFLKYFLILFMGIPVFALSIHAGRDEKFIAVFPDLILPQRIDKNYDPLKMNFLFPRMDTEFEKVIKRWFELCDCYNKSIDLFFSTILNSNFMLLEIEFLRMASVLEAFHREKNPKKNMSFKSRIKEIIQSHPNLSDLIDDVEQFSKQVLDIRDYYAHGFLEKNEKFIPSNMELIFITKKLKLVIIFCLMNELPLNKEEINKFYGESIHQFKQEEKLNEVRK